MNTENTTVAPTVAPTVAKSPVAKSPQAKRWCYTLNNPTQPIPYNELTQAYHVYGEEVGESGTPHYQGFIVFKNLKRLTQLKEINCHAHWEAAKGTNLEASDYCKKDGVFHEFGELPPEKHVRGSKAGNKANADKWRSISDHAKEGDLAWIDANYPKPFVTGYRNLVAIKKDFTKRIPDLPDTCGIWYYGQPGVGKTRLITKLYPDAYLKRMNKWFDGYNNEEVVVIDDLDTTHSFMSYELKKLADRYCYMVEVKNASMYIRPKRVVVTSQYTIEQIWKDDPETVKALKRRFRIVEVTPSNINLLLNVQDNYNDESSSDEEETSSCEIIEQNNIIHSDEFEDFNSDDLAIIDDLEEEYNAKKLKTVAQAIELDKKLAATKPNYEKLTNRLKPRNEYFPDKPIRFSPLANRKRKIFKSKLQRKNAFRVDERLSESPTEGKGYNTPTLNELYDLANSPVDPDADALSDSDISEEY
ncbi:Rep [uncultured virus]|uniref:ATP-dependent helicase Rep n=1 Tax=uncultured virus TaxID=340016 RepID=A0A2K9LSL6_9VIRU|nr:Rep [uncultured virus]